MIRLSPAVVVLIVFAVFIAPVPSAAQDQPEVRAMWVDSFNPGLRSPAEIDALIERAKRGRLNTIVAQVRRNAQSLYARQHPAEGWVEGYLPPAGFDPLQYLIEKAHAEGIEVHAWANIGPVYTGHPGVTTAAWPCKVPCDPDHVFNRHGHKAPEAEYWLTRTHPAFTDGTHAGFPGERTTAGTWFIDLGHPAAADHVIGVLTDLVRNYDVDGIHLDYIRYPEMPIIPAAKRPPGASILGFSIGYNPTSVKRFNAAHGRVEGSLPIYWDPAFSQWRRDQVTAFVRRLYLEMGFIRPDAKLTAALITFFRGPNTVEPRTFQQTETYYRVFQDWGGWMEEGILDVSMPMIYKSHHIGSHVVQFREWIDFTKNSQFGRHGVVGLGSYMNNLENTLVQMAESRAPSATGAESKGFNFFSYNATNAAGGGRPARPRDELFRALTEDGAYGPVAPFAAAAPIPTMPWKTKPRLGHLLAQIIAADGKPADGAQVTIRKLGGAEVPITQFADGNGYVGGVDLQPGAYQLVIEIPGAEERLTVPDAVTPGRVTRVRVDLSQRSRGPMARGERTFGANEKTEHLPEEASALEEWQGREPVPEDLQTQPQS